MLVHEQRAGRFALFIRHPEKHFVVRPHLNGQMLQVNLHTAEMAARCGVVHDEKEPRLRCRFVYGRGGPGRGRESSKFFEYVRNAVLVAVLLQRPHLRTARDLLAQRRLLPKLLESSYQISGTIKIDEFALGLEVLPGLDQIGLHQLHRPGKSSLKKSGWWRFREIGRPCRGKDPWKDERGQAHVGELGKVHRRGPPI